MAKYVYDCDFCGRNGFKTAWRCAECGRIYCDACSKGGRSSTTGKIARGLAGYMSLGLTEAARAGYRKASQRCPSCESTDLIRL